METRGELISIGNDTRVRFHKSKLIIFDSVIFGALGCYSKNWVHPSPGGKPWSSLPPPAVCTEPGSGQRLTVPSGTFFSSFHCSLQTHI